MHTESREQKRLLNQLNNQARSEAIRKNPRRFNCESCNRSYTTNQKLKFHQLSAHGDGAKFACPYCPMMLMNPSTLNVRCITIMIFNKNTGRSALPISANQCQVNRVLGGFIAHLLA